MGRVNKTIEGVFTDIVGNSSEISSYNRFINNDVKNKSKELKRVTELYKKTVNTNKSVFEQLASLEEIIMQMRIRERLDDIKLSQVREYIYARTPFYRKDKKAKDVRVIVAKIDQYPEAEGNIDILLDNTEFMETARIKLGLAMDNEINENLNQFKNIK